MLLHSRSCVSRPWFQHVPRVSPNLCVPVHCRTVGVRDIPISQRYPEEWKIRFAVWAVGQTGWELVFETGRAFGSKDLWVHDPLGIVQILQSLFEEYPQTFLFVYRKGWDNLSHFADSEICLFWKTFVPFPMLRNNKASWTLE